MQWDVSKSYVELSRFSSPAVFNLIDLTSEVQESLHCRICDRSVAANNWAWQHLESKAHAILNPDEIVQLGVKFKCIYCKAINLAVPLPRHQGRGDGSVWARRDPDVDVVMRSLLSRNGFISNTRGQSAHPKIPLEKFSPSGGVSSGILPSRGILKNIILCRHKTFNPPEGFKENSNKSLSCLFFITLQRDSTCRKL